MRDKKKNKKKKQRRIPRHLVTVGHFEFTFPAMNPEQYIAYLKRCPIKHLTLTTEGGNLIKDGRVAHISFVFRKDQGRGYIWVTGTLYTTDHSDTIVVGKTSVEWGDVILVFLVVPITVAVIRPSVLEDLVLFAGGGLILFGMAFLVTWIPKRQAMQLLKKADVPAR